MFSGGYYKYLKKLSEEAIFKGKLHLHKEAVKIDIAAKTVCFSDGSEVVYDKLYSSIPLPEMLQIIEETPQKVREKAELLEFTGVALVWYFIRIGSHQNLVQCRLINPIANPFHTNLLKICTPILLVIRLEQFFIKEFPISIRQPLCKIF